MKKRYVEYFCSSSLPQLRDHINSYAERSNANIIQISYSADINKIFEARALALFEEK